MMYRRIKYYTWYFYFCAYWSAYYWGERRNPERNATDLFGFIWILSSSIIIQLTSLFGYEVSKGFFFIFCGIPAFTLPYLIFKAKKIHLKRLEFDFLKANKYYNKRIIVVWSVGIFLILLNAAVAVIRNLWS